MKIFEVLAQLEEETLLEAEGTAGGGATGGDGGGASTGGDTGGGDSGGDSGGGDSGGDSGGDTGDSSSTTSRNIAHVVYPWGPLVRRPYFDYVRKPKKKKKCKHGKKKDGKCKKKPKKSKS